MKRISSGRLVWSTRPARIIGIWLAILAAPLPVFAADADSRLDWGGGYSTGVDSRTTTASTAGAGSGSAVSLPLALQTSSQKLPNRKSWQPVGIVRDAAQCRALAGYATSRADSTAARQRFAQIVDAPTSVIRAEIIGAYSDVPAVCSVMGLVAPNIQFELRLPTTAWNGKLIHYGCGGACGVIYRPQLEEPLSRGYAVIASDLGHAGVPNNWWFRYANLQGILDLSYRATHVVTLAAREIVDEFYGENARRRYFMGCSTGGVQGMIEAQRYPNDFHAILVGAPAYSSGPFFGTWNRMANLDANGRGIMDSRKLPMIRKAVLAACDARDGTRDGILQDPRQCDWDPAALRCSKDEDSATCLTAGEVAVARKLYAGPSTSTGQSLAYGLGGMARGSEYEWGGFIGPRGERVDLELESGFGDGAYPPVAANAGKPYDFDRDFQRGDVLGWARYGMNPDLRRFRDAGGKMILWHGWDDNEVASGASVDYYEMTTRTMGGDRETRDFFRLFMLPGVAHCRRGPGGDAVDFLSHLEDWDELGKPPEQLVTYHLKIEQPYLGLPRPRYPLDPDTVQWIRPVYPYPDTALWSGRGDIDSPASWKRAPRPRR